jgi:hypothetical protein
MMSVIIPVGRFSFFPTVCARNVCETCGNHHDLDLVFLTSSTIEPPVREALRHAQARVIAAPFDAGYNHLLLLDWAFREADLTPWVVIQHCDLFWRQEGWLDEIAQAVLERPDGLAVAADWPDKLAHFRIAGTPSLVLHDYFGAYNRHAVVREGLRFVWGKIGELPLSPEVEARIAAGDVTWLPWYKNEYDCLYDIKEKVYGPGDWLDGTDAMTLEASIRLRDQVGSLRLREKFHHVWQFFRIASAVRLTGGVLDLGHIDPKCHHEPLAAYSRLTSLFFDRNELGEQAVPWAVFTRLGYLTDKAVRLGEWLGRYADPVNAIGESDALGVREVISRGQCILRL